MSEMSAGPATQLKIGLFVLAAIAAIAVVAFGLGIHARRPTIRFHTYFDESVAGLELGSSVAFRGVRIGNVGGIAIAPDRRRIDVSLDIYADRVKALLPEELVSTLEVSGITGTKLVNLEPREPDFVPPPLSFAPAARYIPSHPSLLAQLELHADRVASRAVVLADHATIAIDRIGAIAGEAETQRVVPRAAALLADADDAVGDLRRLVRGVARAGLPGEARTALVHANATLQRADAALVQVDGAFGIIGGAMGRLRDLAGKLDAGDDVPQAIRDLGDAARSLRIFIDELERQPEIILKGRGRSRSL